MGEQSATSLRIPPELLGQLRGMAKSEDTTVSELLIRGALMVTAGPETVRLVAMETRMAAMEDQVRRLTHILKAAGGTLAAFELAQREVTDGS